MEGPPINQNEKVPAAEEQAVEALKNTQLTLQEQERFVLSISDADLSIEALMLTETNGLVFTATQREHLATNIESSPEAVHIFFINLVESGILEELNETEQWLVNRLRKALLQIEEPGAAEYIRENIEPFLPKEDKK